MYVTIIQHLNYTGQEVLKHNLQFTFLMKLWIEAGHDQGHQTWNESEDPKEGYNLAKFERPQLKSVKEKANVLVVVKSGNTSIIFLEYMEKSNIHS